MKASDLQSKKPADLQKMLVEKRDELREVRFGLSGAAKSTSSAKNLRKDIARIMTVMASKKSETTNK